METAGSPSFRRIGSWFSSPVCQAVRWMACISPKDHGSTRTTPALTRQGLGTTQRRPRRGRPRRRSFTYASPVRRAGAAGQPGSGHGERHSGSALTSSGEELSCVRSTFSLKRAKGAFQRRGGNSRRAKGDPALPPRRSSARIAARTRLRSRKPSVFTSLSLPATRPARARGAAARIGA